MKFDNVKFSDVKEGDVLVADGGFTCIRKGAELTVSSRFSDGLFVPCDEGEHYLDGQLNYETGELIGFSWPKKGD